MSETREWFEIEFWSNDRKQWVNCSNSKDNVTDAFITLGHHVEQDPDMQHRIRRFVQETVVTVPAKEDA